MKTINVSPLEPALNPGTRTAIVIPSNYNNDILSAGLSLMMALRKVNQSVSLLSPTPAKVGDSNLFDIDQLTNVIPSENFVITLKNAVPKLKRVKHFVDGDDLKFMLFPRENAESFDSKEISFGYEVANFDLIIVISQNIQTVRSGFPQINLNNCPILIISNNPNHALETDNNNNIIDSRSKSLCEIIARIIESSKLPVWEDLAYNLFQGLSSATHNFSVSSVTPEVLEVATWAVNNGASRTALSTRQTQSYSQPQNRPSGSDSEQNRDRNRHHDRNRYDRNRDRNRNPNPNPNSVNIRPQFASPNPHANNLPDQSQPSDTTRSSQATDNVSEWESKPKIYQGSTLVDSELAK